MIDRILMFGARDWPDLEPIEEFVNTMANFYRKQLGSDFIVITGGAPGADQLVAAACERQSVHCAVVKALWSTRHRAAGPQRNEAMLWLQPTAAYGFHDSIAKSKGSKDMMNRCKRHRVACQIITHKNFAKVLEREF